MKIVRVVVVLLLTLALAPVAVPAQSLSGGAIYVAQGASTAELFMFSVSGQSFVVSMLVFGAGGNGRWFAAVGSTDGVSGTGQIISPQAFAFFQPAGATFHFDLDQPGGAAGSFTTTGLDNFLSAPSGRFVRIYP